MPIKNFAKQTVSPIRAYTALMREIKLRVKSMSQMHDLCGPTGLHPQAALDYDYLQLRLICELIAIGCMVAHDHPKALYRLRGAWRPEEILRDLEEVFPSFYPIPISNPIHEGATLRYNVLTTTDCLTRTELPKVWTVCGGRLHETLSAILARRPVAPDFTEVESFVAKIKSLLACHQITLKDQDKHFLVLMGKDADDPVTYYEASFFPPAD